MKTRFLENRDIDVALIKVHPLNSREHGPEQRQGMRSILERLGWLDELIVRPLADESGSVGYQLLNGHMRYELAVESGAQSVPCSVVDLTDAESTALLAGFDQIGAMAEIDKQIFDSLATQYGDGLLTEYLSSLVIPPIQPGDVVEGEQPANPNHTIAGLETSPLKPSKSTGVPIRIGDIKCSIKAEIYDSWIRSMPADEDEFWAEINRRLLLSIS